MELLKQVNLKSAQHTVGSDRWAWNNNQWELWNFCGIQFHLGSVSFTATTNLNIPLWRLVVNKVEVHISLSGFLQHHWHFASKTFKTQKFWFWKSCIPNVIYYIYPVILIDTHTELKSVQLKLFQKAVTWKCGVELWGVLILFFTLKKNQRKSHGSSIYMENYKWRSISISSTYWCWNTRTTWWLMWDDDHMHIAGS